MKKLVYLILILLCAYNVDAQVLRPATDGFGQHYTRGDFDSTLYYPTGCGTPSGQIYLFSQGVNGQGQKISRSAFYYDTCGHKLWVYDPSNKGWSGFSSGVIDTTSLSDRINQKIDQKDTGTIFLPFAKIATTVQNAGGAPSLQIDVASNRPSAGNEGRLYLASDTRLLYLDDGFAWRLIGSGGSGGDSDVVHNGDTAAILAPYLQKIVAASLYATISSLTAYLQKVDTGTMLNAYQRRAELTKSSVGLSNLINSLQVVNAGGAVSMQVGAYLSRPAFGNNGHFYIASDSARFYLDNGTSWVTIGGGGGGSSGATQNIYLKNGLHPRNDTTAVLGGALDSITVVDGTNTYPLTFTNFAAATGRGFRVNFGFDAGWDIIVRDSATGFWTRIPKGSVGQSFQMLPTGGVGWAAQSGGGGSGFTTASNLSPLFNTSTSTSTALNFTFNTIPSYSVFGNFTGSSTTAPTFDKIDVVHMISGIVPVANLPVQNIYAKNGLHSRNDSTLVGGGDLDTAFTINGKNTYPVKLDSLTSLTIIGLVAKTATGTDSVLIRDASGRIWTIAIPSGGLGTCPTCFSGIDTIGTTTIIFIRGNGTRDTIDLLTGLITGITDSLVQRRVHDSLTANLADGIYTPTATGTANITAVSAGSNCKWFRVKNTVHVTVNGTAQITANSTNTTFTLTIPVPATFAAQSSVGSGSIEYGVTQNGSMRVNMNASNAFVEVSIYSGTATAGVSGVYEVSFVYKIN